MRKGEQHLLRMTRDTPTWLISWQAIKQASSTSRKTLKVVARFVFFHGLTEERAYA
jgi:hypothetical protein